MDRVYFYDFLTCCVVFDCEGLLVFGDLGEFDFVEFVFGLRVFLLVAIAVVVLLHGSEFAVVVDDIGHALLLSIHGFLDLEVFLLQEFFSFETGRGVLIRGQWLVFEW